MGTGAGGNPASDEKNIKFFLINARAKPVYN
jgi:hypothetical protein